MLDAKTIVAGSFPAGSTKHLLQGNPAASGKDAVVVCG